MTLTVAIDVPVSPGSGAGGVEQHLLGLVDSLATVGGDDIEYVLVVADHDTSWLESYIGENMRIVAPDPPSRIQQALATGKVAVRRLTQPIVKRQNIHNRLRNPAVPDATGEFESLGADIVHFPTPDYRRTDLPTIYNPHDLQHRHYPEYFSAYARKQRDLVYETGCREAAAVDVPSQFVKDDVVNQLGVAAEKVYVVKRGSPTALYDSVSDPDTDRVRDKYNLPARFIFYPAQPLAHKNHDRLVQAIGRLSEDGLSVNLICTGKQTPEWDRVRDTARSAGVADQIQMLGYVPEQDLRALYQCATVVIFPSLFEGGGFPLLEAWQEGVPVACSDTTALGEKAGESAKTFDPESVSAIASALRELWTDDDRREELVYRGRDRLNSFSWDRTGRCYKALYRSVAGVELTTADKERIHEINQTSENISSPGAQ